LFRHERSTRISPVQYPPCLPPQPPGAAGKNGGGLFERESQFSPFEGPLKAGILGERFRPV